MAITAAIIKEALELAIALLKRAPQASDKSAALVSTAIERHMERLEHWSHYVQLHIMAAPLETDDATIPLSIGSIPRRFRSQLTAVDILDEVSLLQIDMSCVVLGGPGAGKTTTIKRLIRQFFFAPDVEFDFLWQLPLLLRIREIRADEPVEVAIARELGFPVDITTGIGADDEGTKLIDRLIGGKSWLSPANERKQFHIGGIPAHAFIADFLNESRALLLLDGLDEIDSRCQALMWGSIHRLRENLKSAKIIVTCRTGDFGFQLEGFQIFEIEPLSEAQISQISTSWLGDSSIFRNLLSSLPYRDLASRPLFLCFLIALYRNSGRLPEHPRHVYQDIVKLSIDGWDRARNLKRPSRYAAFHSEEKLEFLSLLSFNITYKRRTRCFSRADLLSIYSEVCTSFQLPESEATEVASELESHTGLIVENGYDNNGELQYEFSHLSLQEYLCAYFLVRHPFGWEMAKYLQENPAPIAIAVSMSSAPNTWFCGLFLHYDGTPLAADTTRSLIARLLDERPHFNEDELLGLALLRIFFGTTLNIDRFVELPNVKNSLARAIRRYAVRRATSNESVILELRNTEATPHKFFLGRSGNFPKLLYEQISNLR